MEQGVEAIDFFQIAAQRRQQSKASYCREDRHPGPTTPRKALMDSLRLDAHRRPSPSAEFTPVLRDRRTLERWKTTAAAVISFMRRSARRRTGTFDRHK